MCTVKYTVDSALCSGHGQCALFADDLYRIDDEGFNADAGETVEVPETLSRSARAGADARPEKAIRVIP
jgi:ferredoxin